MGQHPPPLPPRPPDAADGSRREPQPFRIPQGWAWATAGFGTLLAAISMTGHWYDFKDINDKPARSTFFNVHQGFDILMVLTVLGLVALLAVWFPRGERTITPPGAFVVAAVVLAIAALVATVVHISSPPTFSHKGWLFHGDTIEGSDLKAAQYAYVALVGLVLAVGGLAASWASTYSLPSFGAERSTTSALPRGRKRCPDCAETVQAAAKVCRYCGHQFAD